MSKQFDVQSLKSKLVTIKDMGYVKSLRRGNTGVGYTLETLLGISENNNQLPDYGKIEIKSARRNSTSMVTLFTFNQGIWDTETAEVIMNYGSYDTTKNRQALYSTVKDAPNNKGLFLTPASNDSFELRHEDGKRIAKWSWNVIEERFKKKMPYLVLVVADTKTNSQREEEFYYQSAILLSKPNKQSFLDLIQCGYIAVDIRMHLRRNHGTAFRIAECHLDLCFDAKETLI